jgi:hypothetical protein
MHLFHKYQLTHVIINRLIERFDSYHFYETIGLFFIFIIIIEIILIIFKVFNYI